VTLWALVPVKPFAGAKTRLGEVLSAVEREALARAMLARTLGVVAKADSIERVLVVSRDPEALAMARGLGAHPAPETSPGGLNPALGEATAAAARGGAKAVLVLPTDLPLLAPEDIRALVERASPSPVVVVAPDRFDRGTNALLMAPPALIEYAFGVQSFRAHAELAQAIRARLEIVRRPGLSLDVDGPDDLAFARLAERAAASLPEE
jgi:2-phospho-L-lactate guanylyltransferase